MRKSLSATVALWVLATGSAAYGQSATYTYDALGRLTGVVYPTGDDVYYAYDAAGNRTQQSIEATTNQPPVAGNNSLATMMNQAATLNPLNNDSDPNGDSFSVTSLSSPLHGAATFATNSVVTYTPTTGYAGADSFYYTITDARGGMATAKISVTVTDPNQPPNAVNDTLVAQLNTPISFDPRVNDTDPNGNALTISGVTSPAHGTASVVAGTAIQYTPATAYLGADTFNYTISDGAGGTDTATVSVTVSGTNSAPNAVNNSMLAVSTYFGTPVRPTKTIDPRTNDSDPDNPDYNALTVTGVTQGSKGSVSFTGTTVKYTYGSTVSAALDTTDTFTYTIADEYGAQDTATVNVTIKVTTDF